MPGVGDPASMKSILHWPMSESGALATPRKRARVACPRSVASYCIHLDILDARIQMAKHAELIYDVGFHRGEDTAFYLKKSFRVVAFEAHPRLAENGRSVYRSGPASCWSIP